MTAKSDELVDELVSACIAFGRGVAPDCQTRIDKARCELVEYVERLEHDLSNKEIEYSDLWGDMLALQERIAELEDAQRWIPVSERLPEVYRDEDGEFIPFLVCEDDKDYPYRAIYDGLNWGDGMFVADVTHWMPLPEPPEVK